MVVKNLKELERELRTRIDYALLTDVTEVVTTVMLDHIERDVYDSYVPHEYVRRYDNGGLMDINNINSSIEGDTLVVENNTMANPYIFVQSKMVKSDNADQELAPIIGPIERDCALILKKATEHKIVVKITLTIL